MSIFDDLPPPILTERFVRETNAMWSREERAFRKAFGVPKMPNRLRPRFVAALHPKEDALIEAMLHLRDCEEAVRRAKREKATHRMRELAQARTNAAVAVGARERAWRRHQNEAMRAEADVAITRAERLFGGPEDGGDE